MITLADDNYLAMTLELAQNGRGLTSPNPMVGAIVVKAGKIISTGFHPRCGGPHAEVVALRKAGTRAAGATVYVNLEPCNHFGRTPPCTQAIIAAGIARVVVGMKDPNPLTNGAGIQMMRRAGITVDVHAQPQQFSYFNRVFCRYITAKLPYLIVKTGQSLDGKLATRSGDSQWITGKASRKSAQELRYDVDAIMVGVNTVLQDDPLLSCRLPGRNRPGKPVKVVLDEKLRTPLNARIFSRASPAAVIIATTGRPNSRRIRQFERRGASVLTISRDRSGRVAVRELLQELARREIAGVLVEGGGEVIGSCFDARLVNEVYCYIAAKIIGGRQAVTAVGGRGIEKLATAPHLANMTVTRCADDVLVHGVVTYPKR